MSVDLAIEKQCIPLKGKPENRFLPLSPAFWAAAAYIGLFIIRPWEQLFPSWQVIHFERTYAIFMILCVIVFSRFRWQWNMQNAAVLTFAVLVGITAVFAWDPSVAWDSYYTYLTQIICYWVLISVVRNIYEVTLMVWAYVGFMEIYLGKALWEYFVNGNHVTQQGVTRLIGIETAYGNHNALAASIVVSLPLWLLLWRNRQAFCCQWPKFWRRSAVLFLIAYIMLATVSVVLTNSRGGMINFGTFVAITGFQAKSAWRMIGKGLLALSLLGALWIVMPGEQKDRIRTIYDPSAGPESAENSKEGRIYAFQAAMQTFRRFPILGVGPGNFLGYRIERVDGVKLVAHSLVGQMLSDTGLAGVVAFVFLVFAIVYRSRKFRTAAKECLDKNISAMLALTSACRIAVILLFIDGSTSDNFYRYNWLWLAAFCSLATRFISEIMDAQTAAIDDKTNRNAKADASLSGVSPTSKLKLKASGAVNA